MIHQPAPSKPRRARRSIPCARRTLTMLGGLGVFLTAAIGLAPAAWAMFPPPEPSAVPVPPPPPPAAAAAHFPLWAVVAMVAATVVLSVATTLITLSLEHLRRARRMPAAAGEPEVGVPTPATAAEPEAEQGEILSSHPHLADYDMYRADSR
jgi:hypothetical protein